jgi:DNA-binding transcriptional regulator YdaS (Cro superfamily)
MKRKSKMLKAAIDAAGGVTSLAKKLGIKKQAVSAWHEIPVLRAREIAKVTGIPREALRPDIYGDDPK